MSKRKIFSLERLEAHLQELKKLIEPKFKNCPGCGRPNRFKGMKKKVKIWPYCSKRCKEAEEKKTAEEFAAMMRAVEIETASLEDEMETQTATNESTEGN